MKDSLENLWRGASYDRRMTTASTQVGDRTASASTPGADRLELRVLGPLEARVDGSAVRLGGRKQRTVLALLAVEIGKRVSVDALIDGVWGEEPTPGRARRCRRTSRTSGPRSATSSSATTAAIAS